MNLLLQYLKNYKGLIALTLFLATINQCFSMLDPYILGQMIDRYVKHHKEFGMEVYLKGVAGLIGLAIGAAMMSRIAKNFQDYFVSDKYWEYRWNDTEKDFNEENYGWVVEVDPFDKSSVPVKRTSLGRFRHENVAIGISKSGKAVAYMGDDKVNECV